MSTSYASPYRPESLTDSLAVVQYEKEEDTDSMPSFEAAGPKKGTSETVLHADPM